jgi:hypothetical protein
MRDGASYLGQPWDSPGNQALKRAVWMAGVNTMSEEECLEVTGENKTDALNHYRRLVGISLAQADLVNTTDFATMQAFVTYLVSFPFLFILEPDALQPLCVQYITQDAAPLSKFALSTIAIRTAERARSPPFPNQS